MKAKEENKLFTIEELEQLRGGFADSEDFVISEEETTDEFNGGLVCCNGTTPA